MMRVIIQLTLSLQVHLNNIYSIFVNFNIII